ncbi:MAG: gamma-glutamylcyclotransferase [Pseudomonadota bacterium]
MGVKKATRPVPIRVILLSLIPLLWAGCFTASRDAAKVGDRVLHETARADTRTKDTAPSRGGRDASAGSTRKTDAPEASLDKNGDARGKRDLASTKSPRSSGGLRDGSPKAAGSRTPVFKLAKGASEDEYVREVARKLADEHSSIERIRICFDSKDEEWWITLYENAGSFYDLKQFVWNIYLDTPEPFLVVERVSRRRLEDHLNAREPNRRCTVLEPGKTGPASALASSDAGDPDVEPAEGSRDHRSDRKSPTQARQADSSTVRPNASKPRPERVEPAPRAVRPHGNRAEKGDGPLLDAERKKPLRSGISSQPHGDRDTRPRPGLSKSAPTLPQTRDERTTRPVSEATTASRSGRIPSSPVHPPNASSPDDLLKPAYRPASAGPREDAKAAAAALSPREKESVERSGKATSLTVRSDPPEAPRSVEPTGRHGRKDAVPTYFVFAYGSKMNHPELLRWLKTHGYDSSMVVDAAPGILDGYDYVWNSYSPTRGGGVVNLEHKENAKVWGLLIEFQDPLLRAFDEREGHPTAYSRGPKRIPVTRVQDGKTVFAWLYLANAHKQKGRDVRPTKEYKNTIIQAARFWEFPKDYVSRLEAWKTR